MRSIPRAARVLRLTLLLAAAAAGRLGAQDTTKTFFTRRDLAYTGIALAGTYAVSLADPSIARWTQHPDIQGGSSRTSTIRGISNLTGETTLTWATVGTYAVGRLAHSGTMADVSLHLIEAQALTSVLGQAVRGVLGRARPSVDVDHQYDFHWGKGFTKFDYRAFPSLHSAAGFVVASGLTEEMKLRHVDAVAWVSPLLYAGALVPGVTRMYLNQHWASDVVAGGFLGTLIGSRVAHYAHTHGRTRLDRWLLGTAVLPDGHGGALVVVNVGP